MCIRDRYKTTWMQRLLPVELQRYFYVTSNSRRVSKDALFTLTEFALVCLEELEEMTSCLLYTSEKEFNRLVDYLLCENCYFMPSTYLFETTSVSYTHLESGLYNYHLWKGWK